MKHIPLKHLIPFFVSLALPAMGLHAEEMVDLTDLTRNDPFFYTSDQNIKDDDGQKLLLGTGRPNKTHSQIPHLPFYMGYMSTNYTYRFVTIAEQVMTLIGEGKHGLWRVQESGTVREYLKKDAQGLAQNADLFAKDNLARIERNYSSFLPDESWAGYKYPDQKVNQDGSLNYIDLPITHPKYKGKYANHEPIELPNFYCTMSEHEYPYAKQAMNFAFNQPAANVVGPLGKRAGLDVRENYTNVLRLNHFPDAKSWVNVGQKGQDNLHVKWEAVDASKTDVEYYLVERPFFNKPYLFITAVYDNKDNADLRYVRPQGAYYDSIKTASQSLKTEPTAQPRFHLENGSLGKAVGLPIYGVHHPNRDAFKAGGACPFKGGDWGRYPQITGGSGWPTQYEEVTPLCDAVLVDIKFYNNLDGSDWNSPTKYMGNAGVGTKAMTYTMQSGEYGVFTDSYNTGRGAKNAESQNVPKQVTLTYPDVEKPVSYVPAPKLAAATGMVPAKGTSCRPIHP